MIGRCGKEVLPFSLKINEDFICGDGEMGMFNVCFLGKSIGDPLVKKQALSQMKRCNRQYNRIIEGILSYDGVRAAMAMRGKR